MATQPKQLWPTTEEYCEAIAFPESYLKHKVLKTCIPVPSKFGGPYRATGGFGVVFKLRSADGKQEWAVKCFTARLDQPAEQYRIVSEHLQSVQLSEIVSFEYLPDAFVVGGKRFPILKMPWCDGITLDQYIKESLGNPAQLQLLLDCWVELNKRLRSSRIAHGDLQHGNVLVEVGDSNRITLRLVDFDGMFVPALSKHTPSEAGHPNYQHPRRAFEPKCRIEFDNFPALVIACALRALIVHGTELWKYNNDDNILFRNTDFVSPQDSPLFKDLWKTHDPQLRCLVANLILACDQPLGQEPFLPDLLQVENSAGVTHADADRVQFILNRRPSPPKPEPRTQKPTEPESSKVFHEPPVTRQAKPQPPPSTTRLPQPSQTSRNSSFVLPWLRIAASIAVVLLIVFLLIPSKKDPFSAANIRPVSMTLIPAGEFLFGSPSSEQERESNEGPQRSLRINRPIYVSTFEVTQAQYEQVMRKNPSRFSPLSGLANINETDPSRLLPVENVSWPEALDFCNNLSTQTGRTPCYHRTPDGKVIYVPSDGFRLLTEIEWEYACRGGSQTAYHCGDEINESMANINVTSIEDDRSSSSIRTVQVGTFPPNSFGLHDLHGNVAEWCWGQLRSENQNELSADTIDISNVDTTIIVTRGGSWNDPPQVVRSARRNWEFGYLAADDAPYGTCGIRIALDVTEPTPPATFSVQLLPNSVTSLTFTHPGGYTIDDPLTLAMREIPAGEFMMGEDNPGTPADGRIHRVTISQPFLISAFEITEYQFDSLLYGKSTWTTSDVVDNFIVTNNFPETHASWFDAVAFCNALSEREGLSPYYDITNVQRFRDVHSGYAEVTARSIKSATVKLRGGSGYRLPTEAEWEYACRAGSTTPYHFGSSLSVDDANVSDAAPSRFFRKRRAVQRTMRVGSFPPNEFGLYDMHGNASEWCSDWFDAQYFRNQPQPIIDPAGPESPPASQNYQCRALRGGDWKTGVLGTSSGYRSLADPDSSFGFRVARSLR